MQGWWFALLLLVHVASDMSHPSQAPKVCIPGRVGPEGYRVYSTWMHQSIDPGDPQLLFTLQPSRYVINYKFKFYRAQSVVAKVALSCHTSSSLAPIYLAVQRPITGQFQLQCHTAPESELTCVVEGLDDNGDHVLEGSHSLIIPCMPDVFEVVAAAPEISDILVPIFDKFGTQLRRTPLTRPFHPLAEKLSVCVFTNSGGRYTPKIAASILSTALRSIRDAHNVTIQELPTFLFVDPSPDFEGFAPLVRGLEAVPELRYATISATGGLAQSHGRCLERVTTPFVLMMEHDFAFIPGTMEYSLEALLDGMEADESVSSITFPMVDNNVGLSFWNMDLPVHYMGPDKITVTRVWYCSNSLHLLKVLPGRVTRLRDIQTTHYGAMGVEENLGYWEHNCTMYGDLATKRVIDHLDGSGRFVDFFSPMVESLSDPTT